MTIGKIGCVGHDCLDCYNNQIELTQLRSQNTELDAACARLEALNAELVEALKRIAGRCDAEPMYKIARAALAKAGVSK